MTRVKPKATALILLGILIAAAVFRLWRLDHADVVTDEAFLGIRALGYLDFLGTPAQGTPSEWYAARPWWSFLSFHDHPPLNFLLQHWSFQLFGENTWALRLPSAIAGIAAVWLLFLIGDKVKNRATGLTAAALGAVELYLIWPARLGLQESLAVTLLLSTVYLFLRAIESPRWWYAVWTVYGLAILTKYTVVVFLPLAISYLLINHRRVFSAKPFWVGQGLQGLITLPLTIYNIALYLDRRHFDLQLSTLLGIDVPAWRLLPGKEIGTLAGRIAKFIPNLMTTASPLLLIAAGIALTFLIARWKQPKNQLVLLGTVWTALLLLVIGPSPRFIVLLFPWLLLGIAMAGTGIAEKLSPRIKPLLMAALFCLLGYQGFYAWHNTFAKNYLGGNPWTFSILRREMGNFGYQQLDQILARELDGFRPAAPAHVQFPVLQQAIDAGFARDHAKPIRPVIISYDADLAWPTPLWYFLRRTLYHGWTAVSTDGLKTALEENRVDALLPAATSSDVLLVVGTTVLERTRGRTESAEWFVDQLRLASSTPLAVVGDARNPQFTLWRVPAEKFQQLNSTPPNLPLF